MQTCMAAGASQRHRPAPLDSPHRAGAPLCAGCSRPFQTYELQSHTRSSRIQATGRSMPDGDGERK